MRAVPGVDHYWTEELHRGWWNDFIGPGKPLDTDKFFIICPNTLGGCYGSTGPSSLNPETGKPYGKAFPHLTATDVVNSLLPLLDHFGIGRLHAIIGPSIGGLLALALAARHPERVHHVIPIASGVKTTVLNRLILFEQILAIENDPHFEGGDYYDRHPPVLGLALARMISHKTFVHLDAIERRARRSVVQSSDHFDWYQLRDPVESYILHQGKTFVDRFDANSYLRFVELWSGFDPVRETGAANMSEIFARCKAAGQEFLVFTIDSDFCFYPEEQSALVSHLRHAGVPNMHVTVHSDKGHDSFLLEPELYAPHLIYTLGKKPG
jgi:homoserine O-acetyltransferase